MSEIKQSNKTSGKNNSVTDELAFELNLLALNVLVEAARSGEQGRAIAEAVSAVNVAKQSNKKSGTCLNEVVHSVEKVAQVISDVAPFNQEKSFKA